MAFFERIEGESPADAVTFLKGLIDHTNPWFENDWLDFKGAAGIDAAIVKRIWSEALSGFANTEGGVLIWGIDARKDHASGLDCAHALSLVTDPPAFHSRLHELQRNSTDPPVSDVEYLHYEDPSAPGQGFVVCLVPESRFKPHRAEHRDPKCGPNYYLRQGDSFFIPSPAILRSLFYPGIVAFLQPEIEARGSDSKDHFECRLLNRGTGIAKNVQVVVYIPDNKGFWVELDGWRKDLSYRSSDERPAIAFITENPIHVGSTSRCFRCERTTGHFEGLLQFSLRTCSENQEPLDWLITFSRYDIDDKMQKVGQREPG